MHDWDRGVDEGGERTTYKVPGSKYLERKRPPWQAIATQRSTHDTEHPTARYTLHKRNRINTRSPFKAKYTQRPNTHLHGAAALLLGSRRLRLHGGGGTLSGLVGSLACLHLPAAATKKKKNDEKKKVAASKTTSTRWGAVAWYWKRTTAVGRGTEGDTNDE